MQKKSSPTRRQFIQKATALTLGTVLIQSCGEELTVDNPSVIDPVDPSEGGSTEPEPEPQPDPTTPTDPEPTDPPDSICEATSADIEGPFYREDPPHRATLTAEDEPGRPLVIEGYVYAADCETPLVGAVVDVWHADDAGGYDNSSEDFRMRGQMTTNDDGYYAYTTIRPGRYLNGATYRPEHIHYKVSYETGGSDNVSLTTQLYFVGDPFLESDPWAVEERTIALEDQGDENFLGRFDVILPVEIK